LTRNAIELLSECSDVIPEQLCKRINVPVGSTYAQAFEIIQQTGLRKQAEAILEEFGR
jgi:hypothetical protein